MQKLQVNVDQIRFAVVSFENNVVVPHLLGHCQMIHGAGHGKSPRYLG